MSRTAARKSIMISVCVGVAILGLLLGFVPQREGFEVRRRINPVVATLRPDDMPAPILGSVGPWAVRASVRAIMPAGDYPLLTEAPAAGRWISFSEDSVRLLTFAGQQHLIMNAVDTLFTPLLPLDGSTEPVVLFGALPQGYGESMAMDGLPLRWRKSNPECDAERPSPAMGSERILTEFLGHYAGGDIFDRARRYQALVEGFATRFGLNPALVYAIIYAESNFTPVLVSSRSAMGLMQLLPSTAGGEVHTFLHGRPTSVNLAELANPEINIRYGTAYLHLLLNKHFGEVRDPLSREYCAIAAYNMGPNRLLRMYPPEIINTMTPAEVLERLSTSLPFAETRAFVLKVTRARETFAGSFVSSVRTPLPQ